MGQTTSLYWDGPQVSWDSRQTCLCQDALTPLDDNVYWQMKVHNWHFILSIILQIPKIYA